MKFKYQKFPFEGADPNRPLIARPLVPVYLLGSSLKTESPYYALLDSGADRVIFPADLAEAVGVTDIRTGRSESTMGIAGQRADVYYHQLALRILGDSEALKTEIGFSEQIALPILGRTFFVHFKAVAFAEAKEEIELRR
jgi:hypothetical protein